MMDHKQLVARAKDWLLSAGSCNPVFTEKGSSKSNEMPDAIGWNSKGSIIVECKVSLADFRADKKKSFRKNSKKGMGVYRYYLFPIELYSVIPKEELPKGWGIIIAQEYGNTRRRSRSFSDKFRRNIKAELYYLRNRLLEIQSYGK